MGLERVREFIIHDSDLLIISIRAGHLLMFIGRFVKSWTFDQ